MWLSTSMVRPLQNLSKANINFGQISFCIYFRHVSLTFCFLATSIIFLVLLRKDTVRNVRGTWKFTQEVVWPYSNGKEIGTNVLPTV